MSADYNRLKAYYDAVDEVQHTEARADLKTATERFLGSCVDTYDLKDVLRLFHQLNRKQRR